MESEVLNSCDRVLATSFSMPDCLMPFEQDKFSCITHGFDQDDFVESVPEQHNTDDIVIYHAGLLNKFRNPINLWNALDLLCAQNQQINDRLKLHFVGNIDQNVIQSISVFTHLKDKIKVEGYKSHQDVLKDYRKASILLLLVNNSPNSKVNIPGKLFEYFAVAKPILAIGSKDADAIRLINETNTGRSFTYEDDIELEALKKLLSSKVQGDHSENDQFSRKNLAKDLAALMESVAAKG